MRELVHLFSRTESVLVVVILIASAVFSLASPYFLTWPNLVDLIEAYSVTTILAAGVFVVLVAGGIDISFAATASAAQYLAAYVATSYGYPPAPMGRDPRLGPISGEVIVLDVQGMRCPDCPSKLALSMLFLPGVKRVSVDFDAREASVTIDSSSSTSPEMLIAAIEQFGFSATVREAN